MKILFFIFILFYIQVFHSSEHIFNLVIPNSYDVCEEVPEPEKNVSPGGGLSGEVYKRLYGSDQRLLEIYGFFKDSEYEDVAVIITALSALETGWLKSSVHNELNNYFSYKEIVEDKRDQRCEDKPIYCMKVFSSLQDCCEHMLRYFRRKGYPTDKEGFLNRMNGQGGLKFAEDPLHVDKVKKIKVLIKQVLKS